MDLLNIGCGPHFHPQWVNVDLASSDPRVIQHDLRRGLPFGDRSFDAVYHSHVLEHFSAEDGESLLRECRRVLRPGGTLRVAVPDLEAIARHYIDALEAAERGGPVDAANLHWMKIELIDQMVRTRSGGAMLAYTRNENLCNRDFVQSRIGRGLFENAKPSARRRGSWSNVLGRKRIRRRIEKTRRALTLAMARLVGGVAGYQALKEGYFRRSGEVHLWMYDRVSLKNLLNRIGFHDFILHKADESRIEDFANYGLDQTHGRVRKPDSLFAEATRPAIGMRHVVPAAPTRHPPRRKSA